jgi:hypothetical protein
LLVISRLFERQLRVGRPWRPVEPEGFLSGQMTPFPDHFITTNLIDVSF